MGKLLNEVALMMLKLKTLASSRLSVLLQWLINQVNSMSIQLLKLLADTFVLETTVTANWLMVSMSRNQQREAVTKELFAPALMVANSSVISLLMLQVHTVLLNATTLMESKLNVLDSWII